MKIADIKHLAFVLKCKATEKELLNICNEITDKEYVFDAVHYREKIEKSITPKGKEKIRIINPSKGRLILIQEAIKKNILDKIQFPEYVQGGVKGRSNITNALMHLGKKYKFTTDIKRFYPSITPVQVYQSFRRQDFIPDVARVLTLLTTYKGRLPQGASTSTHVANLVLSPLDQMIDEYCASHGITYSRYIDDVTLSSDRDFKDHLPKILYFIENAHFIISSPKTFYRHLIDVTGIRVGNNSMKPNEKFFAKLHGEQSEASKQAREQYLNRVKSARKK